MVARLAQQVRRRPVRYAMFSVVLVVAVTTGVDRAVDEVRWRTYVRSCDSYNAQTPSGPATIVSWRYPFGEDTCVARATVYGSELRAAQRLPSDLTFAFADGRRARYVTSLVQAQSRSRFIDDLARSLRTQQAQLRLDDDEYLELIVSAVQSIPYERGGGGMRLPVEVAVEGSGICTEKSVLLAALLLHEGYQTGIWSLEAKRHVAVGVAGEGVGFAGESYAYVESTVPAFVGQVAPGYRAAGPVNKAPRLIPVGGATPYRAGHEVAHILSTLETARARQRALESDVAFERGLARRWDAAYRSAVRSHDSVSRTVDRISSSVCDRAGVYEWLTMCGSSVRSATSES